MKKPAVIFVGIFIIAIIAVSFFIYKDAKAPGQYDNLAKCLTEKGVKFYGAFWCPHCQNEKAMFGKSKQYLPYVECSQPNRDQTQICIDNKIVGYPTWVFPDGTRMEREIKPEEFPGLISCPLN